MALVAIEVKSYLNRDRLSEALDNIRSVKLLNPKVRGIIVGLRGVTHSSLERHLRACCRRRGTARPGTGLDRDLLPDTIYVVDRQYIVSRTPPPDGEFYKAYEATGTIAPGLITDVLTAANVTNLRSFLEPITMGACLFTI